MEMKSPAVSPVALADFSHCWQGVIAVVAVMRRITAERAIVRQSAALPARRGCPELQREPTLKLGNSPYFFNTHLEKQRDFRSLSLARRQRLFWMQCLGSSYLLHSLVLAPNRTAAVPAR
jgi:hypothetical protein